MRPSGASSRDGSEVLGGTCARLLCAVATGSGCSGGPYDVANAGKDIVDLYVVVGQDDDAIDKKAH